jgi:hypothetical protein
MKREHLPELNQIAAELWYKERITWKKIRNRLRKHEHMADLSCNERAAWARTIQCLVIIRGGYKSVPQREEIHELVGYDS